MLDFKKSLKTIICVSVFVCTSTLYQAVSAQEKTGTIPQTPQKTQRSTKQKTIWELHASPSGSFDVRFPKEHKYKLYPLRLSDESVAFSGEIIATHDEKPYSDNVKSYLVKFDQTLGSKLSADEAAKLLSQEVHKYKLGIKSSGGTILTDEIIDHYGFFGKELTVSYTTAEKKEGLRIRIIYTDVARIQQVFTSTGGGLHAYRTNDFFDSIRFFDGYAVTEGELGKDWRRYESPHGMFTMLLPQKHPDYMPDEPIFKSTANFDAAYATIHDPVVNKVTFYNVHAYKTGKNVDLAWAKDFLFTKFVKKFVPNASYASLKVDEVKETNYGTVSTKLVFTPHSDAPYIDAVLLKAYFTKDFIAIQEVIGSQGHAFGSLGQTFMETLNFHPQKFSTDIDAKLAEQATKNKEENMKN